MLEVVVAALLVALIAAAAFTGFSAVAHVSGGQRHQAQANQLAQSDEDRLRGLNVLELSATEPSGNTGATGAALYGNASYTTPIDNETYQIASTAKFVSASSGSTSCTTGSGASSGKADYIATTSTVTWANKNDGRQPVVEHSLISPPPGGGVTVTTTDAASPTPNPISGVTITVTGTDPVTSPQQLITDSSGCAVFGGLDGGTYSVTEADSGYVSENGVTSQSVTIAAGFTDSVNFVLGQPGTATATFQTFVNDVPTALNWDSFSIANPNVTPAIQPFTVTTAAPQVSSPTNTVFPTTYGAYAGTCTTDDPAGSTGTTGTTGAPPGATGATGYIDPTVTVPGASTELTVPTMLLGLTQSNAATTTPVDDPQNLTGPNTVQYTGTWTHDTNDPGNYLNTQSFSGTTNNSVTLTFTGTSVTWLTSLSANHGYANVVLSSGSTTLQSVQEDTYGNAHLYPAYSSATLPYGTYTLKISVVGSEDSHSSGPYVAIDEFLVTTAASTTTITASPLPYTVRTYDSCSTPVARTAVAPAGGSLTAQTVASQTVYPAQAPYGNSVQVCFTNPATGTNTGALPSSGAQIGNTNLNGTSVTPLTLPTATGATGANAVFDNSGSCP